MKVSCTWDFLKFLHHRVWQVLHVYVEAVELCSGHVHHQIAHKRLEGTSTSNEFPTEQLSSSTRHRAVYDNETSSWHGDSGHAILRIYEVQRAGGRATCSNRTQRSGPCSQRVRFEFESLFRLTILVPSTGDSKLTVWANACLGTQFLCRPVVYCWYNRAGLHNQSVFLPNAGRKHSRSGEQEIMWLSIPYVFMTHEQCREALPR